MTIVYVKLSDSFFKLIPFRMDWVQPVIEACTTGGTVVMNKQRDSDSRACGSPHSYPNRFS